MKLEVVKLEVVKLEVVKLEVTKKVGKKVDSSGPDSNKVNFEVMLKVHQID